ncbi:MAG TPA: polysaccharide deacetylase family protein [Tepidisphaeraceae bacterium]|nr:polysaccharide deacetylase family protein [Tepidisphaeraceae bacterium]
MTGAIQQLVRGTDALVARLYLSVFRERDAIVPFLFHSLFRDEREIALNVVDPLQRTTVAQFRQFIEYYLAHGYRFISPADLSAGLSPGGKYALVTFDDGYFNNTLALPILEELRVPAVFFISTNHVRENKSYWWDVLYRERTAEGIAPRKIWREGVSFKNLRADQIESELSRRFGPRAFVPRGDIDRPLNPAELRDFAAHPFVHIGNHTANHAILTNYTLEQARAEVVAAQDALREMTGRAPIAIAYPNGAHSDSIVELCGQIGLKIGFTVRPEKRALPLETAPASMLRLGRFMPHGETPIVSQCRTYRSDVLFYGMFRDGYLRLHRGQIAQ